MLVARAPQNAGPKVALVLSMVDREEGAAEFFKKQGLERLPCSCYVHES
jgi:orotate phosphoribosyltransferase